MSKTPADVDADGIRRVDDKPINGHKSWWKLYDYTTMEVFDDGDGLKITANRKTAVTDTDFTGSKITYDRSSKWGVQIKLITNVSRNKKKRVTKYYVTDVGWMKPQEALELTCRGEIDNARPVFPSSGRLYIRTRRDKKLFNSIEVMG